MKGVFKDKEQIMEVKHGDITITYDEGRNRWVYTVDGRERSAESLKNAKEAINKSKSAKPKKEKAWEPFKAYLKEYSGVEMVTVTSMAERTDCGYPAFWVVTENDKTRSKRRSDSLFKVNDKNAKLVADLVKIDRDVNALHEQKRRLGALLERIDVPKEEPHGN